MSTHAPSAPTAKSSRRSVPTQAATGTRPATGLGVPTRSPIVVQMRRQAAAERTPRLRQIMGICGWAAVLGGVGLVIGVRGFIGILAGDAASWYEPALAITGGAGILLTVTSFLTAHRRRIPWAMLGGASLVLAIAMGLTVAAF